MLKQRNYSLDVCRFFAALFVVMCHVDIFIENAEGLYLFMARFAPRVSVAFFFAISGYYYMGAMMQKKDVFKKQFFSLLKVYTAWSLIYYLASFVVNVVMEGYDLKTFLVERVVFFATRGSYSHFWYFTALIYAVIFATIAFKCGEKKGLAVLNILSLALFVLGNLGSSYYQIGMKIPVICDVISQDRDSFEVFRGIFCMGLPYFMIGYVLQRFQDMIENINAIKMKLLLLVTGILYIAEIFLLSNVLKWYEYPEVFFMLYPFAMVILIFLIKNPKPDWERFAGVMKRLSGYIYYVHPLLILILGVVESKVGIKMHSVLIYLIVIVTAVVSGKILIAVSRKIKWISLFI